MSSFLKNLSLKLFSNLWRNSDIQLYMIYTKRKNIYSGIFFDYTYIMCAYVCVRQCICLIRHISATHPMTSFVVISYHVTYHIDVIGMTVWRVPDKLGMVFLRAVIEVESRPGGGVLAFFVPKLGAFMPIRGA